MSYIMLGFYHRILPLTATKDPRNEHIAGKKRMTYETTWCSDLDQLPIRDQEGLRRFVEVGRRPNIVDCEVKDLSLLLKRLTYLH